MTHTVDTKQDLFFDMITGRIASNMRTNHFVIQKQTEGLSHEDSVIQLQFRGNSMNWVLGHILSSRGRMLVLLGAEPPLTAEENGRYKTGSEPIEDAADALPLERLLADLAQTTAQIEELVRDASQESLLAIIDKEKQTSRLDALLGLVWHETYHVGQFEYLRQAAGTDDKVF